MNQNKNNALLKKRQSILAAKPRIKMDFLDLLISAIKSFPNLSLNVPETILKKIKNRGLFLQTNKGIYTVKKI
jgi:hypothetical protein